MRYGSRIEVVQAVPVVLASENGVFERHVKGVLGPRLVASAALLSGVGCHGLSTDEIAKSTRSRLTPLHNRRTEY